MTFMRPAEFRSTITDDEAGGFRITIPVRRFWPLIAFLGFWLCGWAVGEFAAIGTVIFGVPMMKVPPDALIFMLIWLLPWTLAGCLTIYALLWNLTGREVILLDDQTLEVRREVAGITRSRSFALADVRNLRFSPQVYNPWSMSESWRHSLQFFGISGGSVAFDYGATTYRFGNGLPEIESRRLIKTIRERFKIQDDPVESLPVQT
jgi:hypothetical protein